MIMLFCGFSFIALAYIYFFNVETIPSNALFFIFGVLSITSTFAVLYFDKRVRFMEALGEDSGPKVTLPSKLKRGNTYLIKDIERKRALRLFSAAIGLNFKGLAITRQNPQNIIETFKLKTAKVIWLTELKNGKNLSPTDLEEISYVINNFINQEKRSIIIFDGFEYLSDYNSFAKVLHLFQVLKDAVSIKNSILLIYINPRTMEKNNIKLLESEFKVI
ncbi:DUF835 domain-containing protein [Candidatus Woesearchaeota archaeon]|nr:DUF835 domain-containing protein [Candidatus Woesearchaeota archaeon]